MTALADRLPPHNLKAEMGVLGSILLNNEVLHDVASILKVDDFYRDDHQTAYRAIRDMYDAGNTIDWITLPDELGRRGQYVGLGGDAWLTTIIDSVPHALDAKYYAEIVKQLSIARQLAENANETLREVYSNNYTSDELLGRSMDRIWSIDNSDMSRSVSAADILPEVVNHLAERGTGHSFGVQSGFADLDSMTDGFQPGEFAILAARPSMGKTALSLNICSHVSLKRRQPVLFVSLEMSNRLLVERLVIEQSGIDSHRLRLGALSGNHWDKIRTANETIASAAPIRMIRSPGRSVNEIAADIRREKHKYGIALTVVDYIQLIGGGNDSDSEVAAVTKVSKCLKNLAASLDMPILALSQLNRQAENREDRRPRMSDLRSSGSLEQDADLIALLYRPEYYDPNDNPGLAELDLAKNRNGPTGTVRLTFTKSLMQFSSYSNADERVTYGAENAPF